MPVQAGEEEGVESATRIVQITGQLSFSRLAPSPDGRSILRNQADPTGGLMLERPALYFGYGDDGCRHLSPGKAFYS